MIHHTRGVYPNGDFKDNGVRPEDIEHHVGYNVLYRPGRALFVDGHCVYEGMGVSEELITEHSKPKNHKTMLRCTRPYH